MSGKKFRLADVILSVICVVFVAEAAAPVASIGNSQYFWWLFMIVCFLLPYGLIASELGTAYPGTAACMTGLPPPTPAPAGAPGRRGTTGSISPCGWRRWP